jgi:hypothetical protein
MAMSDLPLFGVLAGLEIPDDEFPLADGVVLKKRLQTFSAPLSWPMWRPNPEAAYFTTIDGQRTMLVVFDMKTSADVPGVEPLFMGFNASVDFTPCMNAEDLKSGLSSIK